MDAYYAARAQALALLEQVTRLYPEDVRRYLAVHPLPTLHAFMLHR